MSIGSAQLPLRDRLQPQLARLRSFGLLPRLLALILLFAVEVLLLSLWLDNASLVAQGGVFAIVGQWGAWGVRGIVGFAALFTTFAYLSRRRALTSLSAQVEQTPVRRGLLAAHLAAISAFAVLSWAMYGGHLMALPPALVLALWLAAGIAAIACAALAISPLLIWSQLIRRTGSLWLLTLALVIAACLAGNYLRALWGPTTSLTFALARTFLAPFVSSIVADPHTRILGTAKFNVEIAPECSGFEGVGLILAFSVCWLWLFRRDCRFPRAFLLVPVGVVTIFLLNSVRIAALILIGNAGAPQLALGGFHSQAGWIAFNAVALGFCLAATHVPWLRRRDAATPTPILGQQNPAAPYLLPFLAILATGMLASAASSGFEWLYPLRFVAAAAVLFALRKRYAAFDWRFSWLGPAIGVTVFALWIAVDHLAHASATNAIPAALAAASAPARIGWIVFRTLAAVLTVPVAEELAFRGFLLRRLIASDFETLPATSFTWPALTASSLAFGLLHGHLWFAGTLAGLLYAWALLRRGRIGEAVAAHATSNALLAAYVLAFHQWHLW